MAGIFIAGTDTGVGKTLVSAALLHAYAGLGIRGVGMKPVAAGAEPDGQGGWGNEDVASLAAASVVAAPATLRNPYLFREAIAPHIAAERKGVTINLSEIRAAYQALTDLAEVVVVEGVGGFRVPLGPREDTADLAVALGLPIVLVVGMRLGCLNHALLTVEAMATRGLVLAGWVANSCQAEMPAYAENVAALKQRLPAPLLAELPHAPMGLAADAASHLFAPKRLMGLMSSD
mgnify:CR=1 FL=1